jgi:hypothetical protein
LSADWVRRRRRERARLAPAHATDATGARSAADAGERSLGAPLPAAFDVEVELERAELAVLLDRAMALLPPQTRRVLVERLVEEAPQARVARRLGLTEGAVEARLHRGKLALRRLLNTELREDAAAYGLVDPEREAWQPTRIWCSVCGQRRLWGRAGAGGYLHLVCRGCWGRPDYCLTEGRVGALLDGVRGFKPAYNRVLRSFHRAFAGGIAGRMVACPRCGAPGPLEVGPPGTLGPASGWGYRELRRRCPRCGPVSGPGSVAGVASSLPAARAFAGQRGRVRALPEREVEAGGVPALVASLEGVAGGRLDVLLVRDSLRVLAVHGAGQAGEAGGAGA